MRLSRFAILTWFFLTLALGSLLFVTWGDRALMGGQNASFVSETGVRLAAAYSPGIRDGGILLLPGFGSDQIGMRSAASEFVRAGLHVFTFDFSGHARSGGALGFDNARTDLLARETLQALREFSRRSGLPPGRIVLLGHSLGARVALQAAGMAPEAPAGLILLGAQVNLGSNAQAEFFTGTNDADLDWIAALGPASPAASILLVSGDWDDILTPTAARLLLCKLTLPDCAPGVRYGGIAAGDAREWILLPGLLHNYEPFSPRVLAAAKAWTGERLGLQLTTSAPQAAARLYAWALGFTAFLAACWSAARWAQARASPPRLSSLSLGSQRRFLWAKLWLWLPALPLSALVGSLVFVIPLPKPVLNLYYVAFLGGYGVLQFILYRLGKMPGVEGRLMGENRPGWRHILGASLLLALALFLTAWYARGGWFYVFPLNLRLFWLALFVPVTTLGFWIGQRESDLLASSPGSARLAHALAGLVPFFIYVIFLAALGSLSGVTAGLQGLLILWLVLWFGNLVRSVSRHALLAAFCQAVLLYWLILPVGVLFS